MTALFEKWVLLVISLCIILQKYC